MELCNSLLCGFKELTLSLILILKMGVKQRNFDEVMRRPLSGKVMKSERKRNISNTGTTKKMTTDNDISEIVKLMIVMTVDSMDNGIEMMDYEYF